MPRLVIGCGLDPSLALSVVLVWAPSAAQVEVAGPRADGLTGLWGIAALLLPCVSKGERVMVVEREESLDPDSRRSRLRDDGVLIFDASKGAAAIPFPLLGVRLCRILIFLAARGVTPWSFASGLWSLSILAYGAGFGFWGVSRVLVVVAAKK